MSFKFISPTYKVSSQRRLTVFVLVGIFFAGPLFLISCQDSGSPRPPQVDGPKRRDWSLQRRLDSPTVVMVSIDGFRADYLKKYNPPTLRSWAAGGVVAEGLIPSFPTLTFPNHITLVTGLRPGNHGIVNNNFYDKSRKEYYSMSNSTAVKDGSWYRGLPLWVAAEKNGLFSATAFWVGSEAKIGGIDPTYLKPYDGSVSNSQRTQWVIDWLGLPAEERPQFISLYFSDVDSAGHVYSPESKEVVAAIMDIDRQLGRINDYVKTEGLDVQFIVVSDHGMVDVSETVDLTPARTLKKFATTGRGAMTAFYSDNAADIEQAYQEIKAIPGRYKMYRGSETPPAWQLNDRHRRGDLIVVGEPGVYIGFRADFEPINVGTSNKSTHGWDSTRTRELDGVFIAHGSRIKSGMKISRIDNIHIYPFVMNLLDLPLEEAIDGRASVLKPILRTPSASPIDFSEAPAN
jgi:predicted AlkP superfamily pyrophosphatase or phosphodiesterase